MSNLKTTKIVAVTTSRADYSHLYWPLRLLDAAPDIELTVLATAAHLSPEYGYTWREIEQTQFKKVEKLECLLSSDSDVGMAKSLGIATLGLADVLARLRPDLLLLIADRYEMLAPASVALTLRIPIMHIEGGDISEGAIDDAVRNALTKMSHVHFTPTEAAQRRVIAMGEESWRVHFTGAPSLDHLRRSSLPDRSEIFQQLVLDSEKQVIVVAYHPVTLLEQTTVETHAIFSALAVRQENIVFCFPNADTGSHEIMQYARQFCANNANAKLHVNLDPVTYFGLLNCSDLLLGNSSSGIMESPSLFLPCINIGLRQRGREQANNIIDVPADHDHISKAIEFGLSTSFRQSIQGIQNPYGNGFASEKILAIIRTLPSRDKLLFKKSIL